MDISVVLNAHHEGMLAHPSCSSIELAKAFAEEAGISVEVLVIVDRPSPETTGFLAHRCPKEWKIVRVEFGDPGSSRNEGVRLAKGRWIAFLDADDLFGVNWLRDAYRAAESDPREVVWHPEINIRFGAANYVFYHADMEEDGFELAGLVCENCWSALCFARKQLIQEVPYPRTKRDNQIGFEDWGWNLAVITRGAIHKVVPGTGHIIRAKEQGSQVATDSNARSIPAPCGPLVHWLHQRAPVTRGVEETA